MWEVKPLAVKCYNRANADNSPPPGTKDRKDRSKSHNETIKAVRWKLQKLQLKNLNSNVMSSTGAAVDSPETTELPLVPEVV